MFEWFATAVASANAAKEISQSLLTLRDAELVRGKVYELTNNLMELQQQMMNAQIEQMELIRKLQQAEAELAEQRRPLNILDRYELYEFPQTGAFAYRIHEDLRICGMEKDHYVCCNCIEAGQKIILQPRAYGLICTKCDTFVQTKNYD